MLEFLLAELAPVPGPLGQPFVDLVRRNRKLVALGGHAQEVEPVHAGDQHVRADGMHLAVAAVGQDQAIVLVVEREALGERFDRVDQSLVGLPGLFLGDDHVGDVGGVGDDHLPALEVDQARGNGTPEDAVVGVVLPHAEIVDAAVLAASAR